MISDFAVCTLDTPEIRWFANYTAASKLVYCDQHNLFFIRHHHSLIPERAPSWSKIPALLSAMEQFSHLKWIWWIDADAAIINPAIDPRNFCRSELDLIYSQDANGLNAGSLLFQNTTATHSFLTSVWRERRYLSDSWWEQRTIQELLKNNLLHHGLIDKVVLNAYPDDFTPDSVVLHYPGHFAPRRGELITHVTNRYPNLAV